MRNLTEISLKNRSLVWYFIAVFAIGGIFSYLNLGRMEDPSFTIREMIISAAWPGASAAETEQQVTDKIERKLQDTPWLDYIESETRAGTTVIYVALREDIDVEKIRPTWRDVRNFCEDIKSELPEGTIGPFYNDRFDDVFGSMYAVTGEDFSYEELRIAAENARRTMMNIPNVQKAELVGVQSERVYVEIDRAKLSELGISPSVVADALNTQNEMTAAGVIHTETDDVFVRVSGRFDDVEAIKNTPIAAGGKIIRVADIAKVERRNVEPPEPSMFFDGEKAIGIAVSMETGGNILELGENLADAAKEIQADLPLGMEIHQVSDQPTVVKESINDFVKTLTEAIVIVLVVSFLSLGLRTGLVVAFCIPLVLAGVFVFMYIFGIDLHKVSLGSLIIALGLLVDDAIIAVEMMSVQLERGLSRFDAACYAFRATAKPMLTGTLVTCAGFIPVAFSKGMASEFCSALFPVIAAALVLSWLVSVMVAPLYGFYLIKTKAKKDGENIYDGRFYRAFRSVLTVCLANSRKVLVGTAAMFFASLWAMGFVSEEFFPPSLRPEIIVDMSLPQGASIAATQKEADRLAKFLDEHKSELDNYSYYVGQNAPRFVLTFDPKADENRSAQFVVVAKDTEAREKMTAALKDELAENFPLVRSRIKYIETGPPADYPIMLRVTGRTVDETKAIAKKTAAVVAEDENAVDVHLDWSEMSKIVRLKLDQDKLREMGITSHDAALTIYTELTGAQAAQFFSGDRTISIDLKLLKNETKNLSDLQNLPVYLGNAGYVPLANIAEISYDAEDGLIMRRNLLPTITVQGGIKSGTANDATQKAFDATEKIRDELPIGAQIVPAGALEDSSDSLDYLMKPLPFMVFIIMTLLMLQLNDIKAMLLTLLTAPLGIIGVAWAILATNVALGFVAYLGILALFGMIIRNSVILIDQIKQHIQSGESQFDAIVDSAILRFRPIMLTAAAAILGMIPLMTNIFWGPMAVAIAGGLLVATVLTLIVLPAMYVVAFNVKK